MRNELAETVDMLADLINSDAAMAHINSIAWLDPIWYEDSDDGDPGDGDDLGAAYHILREAMPELYIDLIDKIHQAADDQDLERFICEAITRRGIEIMSIEQLRFGIPNDPVGIDLCDIDTYEQRPELIPIVEMFGVALNAADLTQFPNVIFDSEDDEDEWDDASPKSNIMMPNYLWEVAWLITISLDDQPDPEWKQLAHLLDWVFGCSGNTFIDCTLDEIEEMGNSMWWAEENIKLAAEMYNEVDIWMEDSRKALAWLAENPRMMPVLAENVRIVIEIVKAHTGKERVKSDTIHLEWPALRSRHAGTANVGPELLHIRDNVA